MIFRSFKKWGVKKLIFSDYGYFKGITGPYVMESRDGAYIMIEAVKSIIYAKSPVSLYGCVSNFGLNFQIILNCLIARQRYFRKISSPMYLLLAK
jgi:hypothetical protein